MTCLIDIQQIDHHNSANELGNTTFLPSTIYKATKEVTFKKKMQYLP